MVEKNIFFFRIADVTGYILNSLYVYSIVSDRNIFNTGFQLICPIKLDHFRCFPDIFPDIFRRFLPARWWRPDADGTKRCRIGIHIVQYSFCMICSLTCILDTGNATLRKRRLRLHRWPTGLVRCVFRSL